MRAQSSTKRIGTANPRTGYRRGTKGQQLLEAVLGIAIVLPIILTVVDFAFIALGSTLNENAARDACRSVSGASFPSQGSQNNPQPLMAQRAEHVLSRFRQPASGALQGPNVESLEYTPPPAVPYPKGLITLTTRMTVKLPVSIPGITPTTVNLYAKRQFPWEGWWTDAPAP